MAKYVELIDKYKIVQSKDTDYNPPSYEWVDNTGEIVRCKNCKWRITFDTAWHPCTDMATNDNWYCADGINREGT